MSDGVFTQLAQSLGERYGAPRSIAADGSWGSLVPTVLFGRPDAAASTGETVSRRRAGSRRRSTSAARSAGFEPTPPLTSPAETAAAHLDEIEEAVRGVPRGTARARALKELGRWWQGKFGDEPSPEWFDSTETLRDELTALPGVNHELADRILLFVAGKAAWPVDRPSIRIACRHGWMDLQAEYDDWQSFFARLSDRSGVSMSALEGWFHQAGRDYCGPRPRCDDCPLRPLLPAGGPLDPEA